MPLRNTPSTTQTGGIGLNRLLGPKTLWEKKRINITLFSKDKGQSRRYSLIDVQACGNLCYHPNVNTDENWERLPGWNVTHILTGCRIITVDTETDARRMTEHLSKNHTDLFSQETNDGVKEEAEEWFVEWILECRKQRKFLDPTPYKR